MLKTISFSDSLISKLTRSIKSYFIINALSILLIFFSQLLLARIMGADDYGVYIYTFSWLGILVLLAKFGLDTTLTRFIPQYLSTNKWALYKGITIKSYQLVVANTLIITLLLWLGLTFYAGNLDDKLTAPFHIALFILPLLTLVKISQAILLANKRPVLSQLGDGIISPIGMIILALSLPFIFNIQANPENILTGSIVVYITALTFSLLLGYYYLPISEPGIKKEYNTRLWLTVSAPILFISSMHIIMKQTDVLLIGYLIDTTQAGIYSVCSRIAAFVSLPLVLAGTALSPYISELFHKNKISELQTTITTIVYIGSFSAAIILLLMWLFGEFILSLFGTSFTSGMNTLLILSIGQIINALSGVTGLFMTMTGHQTIAAYFLFSGALLNIVLNIVLIPILGIQGAAIATITSMIFWNVIVALFIIKKTGINTTIFSAIK